MDPDFTALLEDKLDEVAQGERQWVPVVQEFYEPLHRDLERANTEVERLKPAEIATDEVCSQGHPMVIKEGRFGRFLACTNYPEHKETRPLPEELPPGAPEEHCSHGVLMQLRTGRFGPFYTSTHECGETKPFAHRVGVPCPIDGGDILEKRSKKGRVFYGCANWPECEWVSFYRAADRAVSRVRRHPGRHGPGPRALPEARGRAAAVRRAPNGADADGRRRHDGAPASANGKPPASANGKASSRQWPRAPTATAHGGEDATRRRGSQGATASAAANGKAAANAHNGAKRKRPQQRSARPRRRRAARGQEGMSHPQRLRTPARRARRARASTALLVSQPESRFYLSGYAGHDLPPRDSAGYLLDHAHAGPAADRSAHHRAGRARVARLRGRHLRRRQPRPAGDRRGRRQARRAAASASSRSTCRTRIWDADQRQRCPSGIELAPVDGSVDDLRVVKDAEELASLQEAIDVLDRCLADVLRRIEPGLTERQVARMVELYLIEHADGTSFPSIVASGPNASVPHAVPSDRRIQEGEVAQNRHRRARQRLLLGHDPHGVPRRAARSDGWSSCTRSCSKPRQHAEAQRCGRA